MAIADRPRPCADLNHDRFPLKPARFLLDQGNKGLQVHRSVRETYGIKGMCREPGGDVESSLEPEHDTSLGKAVS
jgi:hypothetical protein